MSTVRRGPGESPRAFHQTSLGHGIDDRPTAINAIYAAGVAAALHPVFQTAAAVMVVAFALSWRLRDVPLREATQAPVGASEPELRTLAGSSGSGG